VEEDPDALGEPVKPRPQHLPRPLGGGWVFTKRSWFLFFLREITCIFVGLFALLTILFVRAVAEGPEAYEAFLSWLKTPWVIAFHVLSFAFLLLHTLTWFVAAPTAIRPKVGDKLLAPRAIVAGHYVVWLAVSAVLVGLLL
jgi:fumarate reductase subunit C